MVVREPRSIPWSCWRPKVRQVEKLKVSTNIGSEAGVEEIG